MSEAWVIAENGFIKTQENGWIVCHVEDSEDARLIAAAPDLLEALKGALEFLEDNEWGASFTADDARIAIAKAEGRA